MPVDKYVLSTMTAPVLVAGVATAHGPKDLLFILGANDIAVRAGCQYRPASSGRKASPIRTSPPRPSATGCAPSTANATPTIDKARGIVFFITSDGMLRGLNLADGAERLTPVPMAAPFARAWSLNLIDNVLYSPSGRACGEVTDKISIEYAAAISGLRRAGNGSAAGRLRRQCRRCQRPGPSGGDALLHQRRASRRALGPRRRRSARPAAWCWKPATAATIRPPAISAKAS